MKYGLLNLKLLVANICTNNFYLSKQVNDEDFKQSASNLKKFLDDTSSFYDEDDDFIEGSFNSKWTFPMNEIKNLLVGDVYFRCLSEEYGCGYVAMNIYDEGWQSEQTFDI